MPFQLFRRSNAQGPPAKLRLAGLPDVARQLNGVRRASVTSAMHRENVKQWDSDEQRQLLSMAMRSRE